MNTASTATPDPKYVQSLGDVTAFYNAISNQALPVLSEPVPPAYTAFTDQYVQVKTDSFEWIASILPKLYSVASDIMSSEVDGDINQLTGDISRNRPQSQLTEDMNNLLGQYGDLTNIVTAAQKLFNGGGQEDASSLLTFMNTMSSDYNSLQNQLTEVNSSIKTEQVAIESLKAQIANLKNNVAQLQSDIVWDDIEIGASVTATVITFFLGPIAWGLGATAITLSAINQIKDSSQLKSDQSTITQDNNKLGLINKDIIALNVLAIGMNDIIEDDSASCQGLKYIYDQWSAMCTFLTQLQSSANELNKEIALGNTISPSDPNLLSMQANWSNAKELATKLTLSSGSVTTAGSQVTIALSTK